MGAWGSGPFENDTAMDWTDRLAVEGLALVQRALRRVTSSPYIDMDAACEAHAAAELVSCLVGAEFQGSTGSEEADAWLAGHRLPLEPGLVELALEALNALTTRPGELRDLAGSAEDWALQFELVAKRLRDPDRTSPDRSDAPRPAGAALVLPAAIDGTAHHRDITRYVREWSALVIQEAQSCSFEEWLALLGRFTVQAQRFREDRGFGPQEWALDDQGAQIGWLRRVHASNASGRAGDLSGVLYGLLGPGGEPM